MPGDIVRLYLGDVVPADCNLIQGDYISIDQSALTGESLPVTKKSGEEAYSDSVVKQGEMVAVVTATGSNTTFGVFVLPIVKGTFGVPAVLGMMAAVSLLGLIVTLVFGREDTG